MSKTIVLLLLFIALAGFIYFYEIQGEEGRVRRQELEESLFRIEDTEAIERLVVERPAGPRLELTRQGDRWKLDTPVQAPADTTTVDALINRIEEAKRERTLEEVSERLAEFGLDDEFSRLSVFVGEEERVLLLGQPAFSGSNVYAKFDGSPEVFLTSDALVSALEKGIKDWRDKRVLDFNRTDVVAIEISRQGEMLRLEKFEDVWQLKAPLEDAADPSSVSSLLGQLESARVRDFVSEDDTNLQQYGLQQPGFSVRLRLAGQEGWKALSLGNKEGDTYYAKRDGSGSVFTLGSDLYDKLTQDIFEFRDRDVVDVQQDQVARLKLRTGEDELEIRREDFKWIIEKPEESREQEALAYKFWYPIDDIEFTTLQDSEGIQGEVITLVIELNDGREKTYRFWQRDGLFWAGRDDGRQGMISEEDFEKLKLKAENLN